MGDVVSESQSAFVLNRLITDNFLIAYEINHFLNGKTQGREGVAALKIDMSKTYDHYKWGFLYDMMNRLGFSDHWIKLI